MIENLYNAIRATAGSPIPVEVRITGTEVSEHCHLMLFDDVLLLGTYGGEYNAETDTWLFTIPSEDTEGLTGRYWYCICEKENKLCFRQPLYLV